MKILVTGGAGFIGSALCRRLFDHGHHVVALDDFSRGKTHRLPQIFTPPSPERMVTVSGDIRDPYAVKYAAAGCDAIFHLAYVQGTQTFYEKPRTVIDVALKGILNVLENCEGKELFLVSSSEVYQVPPPEFFPTAENVPLTVPDVTNPRYSYGGGKIASEVAAFAHSDVMKRLVVLRPHNIYGPDMGYEHVIPQFAERIRQLDGEYLPIQGSGFETRCFCHISDCVGGFMYALERGEHRAIYHVGNPDEEITMGDLAHKIARWWGKRIEVQPGELPQGSPTRRLPDISRLKGLGYEPMIRLDEGLGHTLEWYRDHA